MKKVFLASMIVGAFATSMFAAKIGETSVGFEFGASNTNATTKATNLNTGVSASETGSTDTTYEGIKVGNYFDYGRVGVSVGHVNEKDNVSGNYLGLTYDYMFYNDSKVTPFIGGTVAYSDAPVDFSPLNFHETGMEYGGEIGILYDISKELDLEIGARYLASSASGNQTVSNIKVEVDVNTVMQYYFGLNYKF
jgi:hypothetical protein